MDIDEAADEEAVENFEYIDWGDRLFCYHDAFYEFVVEMQDEQKYDLIVSNPPFYSEDFTSENTQRNQARFAEALPFSELLAGAAKLLSEEGIFSCIIPHREEENFLKLAEQTGLFPQKMTRVKGTKNSGIKRSLLNLGVSKVEHFYDELFLEIASHNHTEEYKQLVSPFYLKL